MQIVVILFSRNHETNVKLLDYRLCIASWLLLQFCIQSQYLNFANLLNTISFLMIVRTSFVTKFGEKLVEYLYSNRVCSPSFASYTVNPG